MEDKKRELFNLAVKLETNICRLYIFYRDHFTEEGSFWAKMAEEESHHASIVELAGEYYDKFPQELIYSNAENLKKVNRDIEEKIKKYAEKPPSRREAYEYAYNLENSAYEFHFQNVVSKKSESREIKRLKELNKDDRDHAERIKKLLERPGTV
ncbi:MAG: hypothetical protein JW800_07100 [Candidatus Omnitrophica bacterium]|nr:hypothetical protein [Candidatus Omnitrophota bacterium]